MSLASYLTTEEKNEITELKSKLLEANTMMEIRFCEKEIHYILDLAEERYHTDPERNIREKFRSSDIMNAIHKGISTFELSAPFSKNISYIENLKHNDE